MARTLKTRGMLELHALRGRVRRQRTLGRIDRTTSDQLEKLLGQVEVIIINCRELNEEGEEEGIG